MSYIDRINNYWNINQVLNFPPQVTALYFYTLHIFNTLFWRQGSVRINAAVLCAGAGINRRAFLMAAHILNDAGLMEYVVINGSKYVVINTEVNGCKPTQKPMPKNNEVLQTYTQTYTETMQKPMPKNVEVLDPTLYIDKDKDKDIYNNKKTFVKNAEVNKMKRNILQEQCELLLKNGKL